MSIYATVTKQDMIELVAKLSEAQKNQWAVKYIIKFLKQTHGKELAKSYGSTNKKVYKTTEAMEKLPSSKIQMN